MCREGVAGWGGREGRVEWRDAGWMEGRVRVARGCVSGVSEENGVEGRAGVL
jgi:hypothetical protein